MYATDAFFDQLCGLLTLQPRLLPSTLLSPHCPGTPHPQASQRSCSRSPIAFYRAIGRQQRSYCILREHQDAIVLSSECCSTPFYNHRRRFVGSFFPIVLSCCPLLSLASNIKGSIPALPSLTSSSCCSFLGPTFVHDSSSRRTYSISPRNRDSFA